MRWWLVVLCACNQVLGLHGTHLPPPDAPPACPDFGTPPQFSFVLTQIGSKFCTDYTESASAGLAMALCLEPNSKSSDYVETGPIGGDLAIASDIVADVGFTNVSPRLSADGDEAIVGAQSADGSSLVFNAYSRSGTTWTRMADRPFSANPGDMIGTITLGPQRRVLITHALAAMNELDADTGDPIATYQAGDLGLAPFGSTNYVGLPALSDDGLRLVMLATPAGTTNSIAVYTDRASTTARFGPVQPLPGVPPAQELFLAHDCARIYYSSSAIHALFYAREAPQ
jgi:hypothetical protein